jgi:hypothetical protein
MTGEKLATSSQNQGWRVPGNYVDDTQALELACKDFFTLNQE